MKTCRRLGLSCLVSILAWGAGAIDAALALSKQQLKHEWQRCEATKATPDERIAGCTAVIASKRERRNNLVVAYNARGVAWSEKGDLDRALADFEQAIKIDPRNAPTYNNRGNAWLKRGRYDRAIADYDEAIRFFPELAAAYNGRAAARVKRNELDAAIADFDLAVKLDPDDPDTYCNRGDAWLAKGNAERALADFRKALALEPAHKQALDGLRRLGAKP